MELGQMMHAEQVIRPQSLSANSTTTANIDCSQADYVVLRISFGTELNTNAVGPAVAIKESDTTVATSFTTHNSSLQISTQDCGNTNGTLITYGIPMTGIRKRYQRLEISVANSTNNPVSCSAIAELWNDSTPVGTVGMGDVAVVLK